MIYGLTEVMVSCEAIKTLNKNGVRIDSIGRAEAGELIYDTASNSIITNTDNDAGICIVVKKIDEEKS